MDIIKIAGIVLLLIIMKNFKFIYQEIKQLIFKREQIKADAMVRVEEIRARNQLELEKLIMKENSTKDQNTGMNQNSYSGSESCLENSKKEKYRL